MTFQEIIHLWFGKLYLSVFILRCCITTFWSNHYQFWNFSLSWTLVFHISFLRFIWSCFCRSMVSRIVYLRIFGKIYWIEFIWFHQIAIGFNCLVQLWAYRHFLKSRSFCFQIWIHYLRFPSKTSFFWWSISLSLRFITIKIMDWG